MTNKEKTILKRFFKSIENNSDFYNTYYQDENGLYYLINMYSCIRFTARREDIIKEYGLKSGDPKKISRLNLKEIIENNTNKNYNYYSATVSAADLRIFKAYAKREDKPFLTCYNSAQYIGFNPSYMLDIFDLMKTSENTIYIYDSKSPIILNNVDFDAFILPINTRNTDITTYSDFLTTLNDLKSIQEKKKEEKASEKKNMTVLSLEEEVTYNGFTMWIGGKQYFLMSDKKRVTDEITKDFLKLIAANTTINVDKISESDFRYIKNGINSATITKTKSYSYGYEIIRIQQKNSGENFYSNEYNKLLIYNADFVKICLDELNNIDMSSVKASTDTTQDTKQTETTAHKSNNCLFVTVAKDLKPEKVAQLQNVANLPTLASIPTYSAYFVQKINNIVSAKRNTNKGRKTHGRKAHGRTNGATLAECAGVLKAANTS